MSIPHISHWIWFDEKLADWDAANVETFRLLHSDWQIQIWQELPDVFPCDLRDLINRLPWYSSRSDIFRYWLLAEYGGVYLDTDVVALRSFDCLLEHDFFLAPCQPTGHTQPHLACGLMGSVPGSHTAQKILGACRIQAEVPEIPRRITYGPDLLTKLFADNPRDVTILPLHYFYAIPDRETTHEFWQSDTVARAEIMKRFEPHFTDDEQPYAMHLWGVNGSSQRKVTDLNLEVSPSSWTA